MKFVFSIVVGCTLLSSSTPVSPRQSLHGAPGDLAGLQGCDQR